MLKYTQLFEPLELPTIGARYTDKPPTNHRQTTHSPPLKPPILSCRFFQTPITADLTTDRAKEFFLQH